MPAKEKLSRERIICAAMEMLDEVGEKGFSMRKLAGALGVDPMAIYHHHTNKSALLQEVLQTMLLQCHLPEDCGNWRKDIRNLCNQVRELAQRHPGCFRLYEIYEEWLPAEHRLHEAFHRVLLTSGLPGPRVVQAVRLLLAYTEAFAVDEISGWLDPEDREDLAASLAEGPYPVMTDLINEIGHRDTDADFDALKEVLRKAQK